MQTKEIEVPIRITVYGKRDKDSNINATYRVYIGDTLALETGYIGDIFSKLTMVDNIPWFVGKELESKLT